MGVRNSICVARIRSFARGGVGGMVITGGFLSPGSRILVVSSFLTGNYTLRKLVTVIGRTNTAIRKVKVTIRGNFRPNNEAVEGLNCRLRSLTVVRGVSSGTNAMIFERRWGSGCLV